MVSFEPSISKYDRYSILGQGYNGAALVHLAKHTSSGKLVAIKKVNMEKVKEEAVLVQVDLFLNLKSKNLVYFSVARNNNNKATATSKCFAILLFFC